MILSSMAGITSANTIMSVPDTSATTADTSAMRVSVRRYRPRGEAPRARRLTPRFTDGELAQIQVAAVAARMTVTGFCARAALTVARREPVQATSAGRTPDGVQDLAELQAELFAARTAVNRTGTNLNQAVVALNSNGVAPVWLEHAVERVARAVAELDAVAARIHRRLA